MRAAVQFEPNILGTGMEPRMVYFDKNTNSFDIYSIKDQESLSYPAPEKICEISDFSYVDANGQIFIVGGEVRSNSEGYL